MSFSAFQKVTNRRKTLMKAGTQKRLGFFIIFSKKNRQKFVFLPPKFHQNNVYLRLKKNNESSVITHRKMFITHKSFCPSVDFWKYFKYGKYSSRKSFTIE
jgi:hypothetical protein